MAIISSVLLQQHFDRHFLLDLPHRQVPGKYLA
jgi:hypothetical protein